MTERESKDEIPIKGRKGKTLTGINGLDLALDGGFLPGTSILVIGNATSGIDRFAYQFWKNAPDLRQFIMIDGPVNEGMTSGIGISPDEIFSSCITGGLVIDSLSSVIRMHGTESVLPPLIRARDAVNIGPDHLFCIMYPNLHDLYDEIRIIRLFDIVISMYEEIRGSEVIRTLDIKKIIGSPPPGRVLPFLISEKGIELSTTSRVV